MKMSRQFQLVESAVDELRLALATVDEEDIKQIAEASVALARFATTAMRLVSPATHGCSSVLLASRARSCAAEGGQRRREGESVAFFVWSCNRVVVSSWPPFAGPRP